MSESKFKVGDKFKSVETCPYYKYGDILTIKSMEPIKLTNGPFTHTVRFEEVPYPRFNFPNPNMIPHKREENLKTLLDE